jgi:glucoamylase
MVWEPPVDYGVCFQATGISMKAKRDHGSDGKKPAEFRPTAPYAPGWPGIDPRWTSSAKSGVGTAISGESRVWFTLGRGICNEIYYPRIDQACTRDLGLIVTRGRDLFSEERRDTDSRIEWLEPGVPAFRLINKHRGGAYRIEKEILTDPCRDSLLQQTRFVAEGPHRGDFHLYVLLAPHLGNRGLGNTAWVGDFGGRMLLMAQRGELALALACSAPWLKMSAGFAGHSDGWQDLRRNGLLTAQYERAENGNVALTGEVDLGVTGGGFLLALGFGGSPAEAAGCALASLSDGFPSARRRYVREWRAWHGHLARPAANPSGHRDRQLASAALIRAHESKEVAGGIAASLSIPWGYAHGDDDIGGYHMIWPRDLVEAAGGLLALGAKEDVRRVLHCLQRIQDPDGHWPQNMWMDGTPFMHGVQLDETAFPILLVAMAFSHKALDDAELKNLWPMVRRAAAFLVRSGPVTGQDRWEEDAGYATFTLAAAVAALLAAAELAERNGEGGEAGFLRETADYWNENIERWTYVTGTKLAARVGVEGYYVRIAPPGSPEAVSTVNDTIALRNRAQAQSDRNAAEIVSPDALALVRFGLRAADDPRIVNTVKVIDALLKRETPRGPVWHRYDGDGYGEHADGSAFDGTGIGCGWPLLVGERAHYEVAAGRIANAARLLEAMEAMASEGGLLPEQVWDSTDIPERSLFIGRPSGSAMPLVWAHAEHIKLRRSIDDGRVWDLPPSSANRYLGRKVVSPYAIWRFNHRCRVLPPGKTLRVEVLAAAVVRWSDDGWRTVNDTRTRDTGLGFHVACLSAGGPAAPGRIEFTFQWIESNRWEGSNFAVEVAESK